MSVLNCNTWRRPVPTTHATSMGKPRLFRDLASKSSVAINGLFMRHVSSGVRVDYANCCRLMCVFERVSSQAQAAGICAEIRNVMFRYFCHNRPRNMVVLMTRERNFARSEGHLGWSGAQLPTFFKPLDSGPPFRCGWLANRVLVSKHANLIHSIFNWHRM